jgi:hypothetical protein
MTTKTHEEKIQHITAKCAEVNPEIMELKFGNKIKNSGNVYGKYLYYGRKEGLCGNLREDENGGLHHIYPQKCWHWLMVSKTLQGVNDYAFKNLGRDININDILMLLNKCAENEYLVDDRGTFCHYDYDTDTLELLDGSWDLSQNALHLQSDDLITWLYEIIGGE